MKWELALIAATVLAVAGVSRRLTGTPVTPAMVFVLVGVLVGPLVIDEVTAAPTGAGVRTLAEATLAVVLFADASRIKPRVLRREYAVPLRLLGIGLPLTIALGAVLAALIFDQLNATEAIVLAILLAPTDAALGEAVVTEPRLPSRIRQGLNVESGLNDGICVPLLLIALAAADVEANTTSGHHALSIVAEQIGYGILGGVAAGAGRRGRRRGRLPPRPDQRIVAPSHPGRRRRPRLRNRAPRSAGRGSSPRSSAGCVFGALVAKTPSRRRASSRNSGACSEASHSSSSAPYCSVPRSARQWQIVALRRAQPDAGPDAAGGDRDDRHRRAPPTVGFLGWFGPRGLASIVFAVIVVEEAHLPGADTILATTYVTIGLSVIAHGITAAPLAQRYARWYESHPRDRLPAMESVPAPDHRTRGAPQPAPDAPA